MGIKEIAIRLNLSTARIVQIVQAYEDFPPPEANLAAGRVWSSVAVEAWIERHPNRRRGRPRKNHQQRPNS